MIAEVVIGWVGGIFTSILFCSVRELLWQRRENHKRWEPEDYKPGLDGWNGRLSEYYDAWL